MTPDEQICHLKLNKEKAESSRPIEMCFHTHIDVKYL